jgi:hypothetical protein
MVIANTQSRASNLKQAIEILTKSFTKPGNVSWPKDWKVPIYKQS